MSSGLPMWPDQARGVVKRLAPMAMQRIANLGMTPRQSDLNWYFSWYATCRYDARKVEFDGAERVDRIDGEAIATTGVVPGGFYQAAADFPLRFRRPAAPYNLPRVIVNRFTGLLFSESQHPSIRAIGDQDLEDYANALAEQSRLWAAMIQVRSFGGATGSACVGFKFLNGEAVIEVHDPRWVTPKWKNRELGEVSAIDKRWMWPEDVLMEDGEYQQFWYWSRRLIDEHVDVAWDKVPVGDGNEPAWAEIKPDRMQEHNFGFCPVRWIQNTPVVDADDGEPDCIGTYDMVEEMDVLLSLCGGGLKANLDPTLIITSDQRLAEIRKGSDNAVKLEKGADAKYLEIDGAGVKEGREHAMVLRGLVLEVAQCVLDHEDESTTEETATKSRMRYAAMTSRADVLREQYGQRGVLSIVRDMIRAIRKITATTIGPDGRPTRSIVNLPPREITAQDGTKTFVKRTLPPEDQARGVLSLQWPPYFRPSLQDATAAATAVKTAKDAGGVSDETAVNYLQPYFGATDAQEELRRINAEAKKREEMLKAQAAASWAR